VPVDMTVIANTRRELLARYPAKPPISLGPSTPSATSKDVLVMSSIHRQPFVGIDVRASTMDMSSQMLRRTIASLEAKAWLQQVPFSRRTRGYIRYCNLTKEGLEAVHLDMPDQGTGSFLHRRCQRLIQNFIKTSLHVDAGIEYRLNGKNVDIGYSQDERKVAFEVGLHTAENELSNITKDIEAGFNEIHVLFRDSTMLQRVQELAPKSKAELKLELLTDYLEQTSVPTET